MSDTAGLQQSLAAMGFIELGLAFVSLCGYALMLNGALGARARTVSGGGALLAAALLAALADPWVNGVILVALGIGGIGIFVVVAWGISRLCGLGTRRVREPLPAEATLTSPVPLLLTRPHGPAHSS